MKQFSRVYIELTNLCNLACSFCVGNTRPQQFLSPQEFSHILTQVKPYTDHIYFHVLGEPLLHPQLAEFLDLAAAESIKVNITTNGTLLPKWQRVLLSAPALRKVSVSLHSLETPDPQRRQDYIRQVADFARAAVDGGKICELRLWNLGADGIHNEDIYTPLCQHLGIDEQMRQQVRDRVDRVGCTTLEPKLFLGTAERFQWPSLSAPLTEQGVFCYGLRNHAAILCDGTVVPCCLDSCGDVNLGNVFETPFGDILDSPRAKALYEGFSHRKPTEELCRRCGYATRF